LLQWSSAALNVEASVREEQVLGHGYKRQRHVSLVQASPTAADCAITLIQMYGTDKDHTLGVELGALGLGMLEDWICATYLVAVLWLIAFNLSQTLEASSDSMTPQTFIT
ncbi:hypothetical protein JG687_00018527, partial [Phytophthora cactorum]